MSEEYRKEMRKMERQEKDLTSQYTDEPNRDINDYHTIVNAKFICTPDQGETWAHYADRVAIYAKLGADKSRLTHIDGPRKAWYTHRVGGVKLPTFP